MSDTIHANLTPETLARVRQLRASAAEFQTLVATLPADERSSDHNEQFNQLRADAKALLGERLATAVPPAITGDVTTDRSIFVVAILGVFLALLGLGVNSIILEDVVINSLGCCVSSGGMLLIVGAFGVLSLKNFRERVSTTGDLYHQADLLLHQLDHHLRMEEPDS